MSEHRDELFAIGELAETDVAAFQAKFEERREYIDGLESDLPETPDMAAAQQFLVDFRRGNL